MGNQEGSSLEIDKFALDEEWIEQPRLYFLWAERAAAARRDWDQAKANLDVVKAELDQDVRSNPGAFGVKKVTNPAVEAAILSDGKYKDALAAVIRAKYKHEVAAAMVAALEHRRTALGKLVDLHLASYYAEPRTKANRDQVENMKKDRAWKSKEQREREREEASEDD